MENQREDPKTVADLIPVRYVRNIPFPVVPWFPKENTEASFDYKPRDGDIILSTYPKTGSTWLQYIVWEILHKGETFPSFNDMSTRLVPFMEMSGIDIIDSLEPPRFYKNHFRYNMMIINEKAKYLYIYRDPKDTVVSYFHFHHALGFPAIDFDTFFEVFLKGKIYYGDYFDHILSIYPHRNAKHILFLSYEELKKDTKNMVLRIAKFLGEDYYKMLKSDEVLIAKILEVTSFDYMKKNLSFKKPMKEECVEGQHTSNTRGEGNTIEFFRKGTVGDGKNVLSEEQTQKLRKRIFEKMKGTELAELWLS